MSEFIDVHTFDGKLHGIFTPNGSVYTVEEKTSSFNKLITCLTNPIAIRTVEIMIRDQSECINNSNFQPENNLDASDILMEIVKWIDNPDVLKGLDEQLADAGNLGICPSGRCTRLLQIWLVYKK